jgi:hypothetical protein
MHSDGVNLVKVLVAIIAVEFESTYDEDGIKHIWG